MQKTGCTHIASILDKLFDGESTIIKHNAATPEQLKLGRFMISSIRNPWDWYLSLWTFGVQGGGGFMNRLTRLSEDNAIWLRVYDNAENIDSFRKWLKMINDPSNSRLLGEGYGGTNITELCGFMTYRYLYLCSSKVNNLSQPGFISTFDDLAYYDKNNCYINYFIRQEALEETLCHAVEMIRPLTQQEKELILGFGKTNTSVRKLSISDYYDADSIKLIEKRERLIIEKFSYSPPI